MRKLLTSESVNIGHPDKTCDVIADSFLDEALRQDPYSQMAVECAIKDDKLFVYGEATTKANIDYEAIAKEVLKDILKNMGDLIQKLYIAIFKKLHITRLRIILYIEEHYLMMI